MKGVESETKEPKMPEASIARDPVLACAEGVTRAYIAVRPSVSASEAVDMLLLTYAVLAGRGDATRAAATPKADAPRARVRRRKFPAAPAAWVPRVPVRESVAADDSYLVCLADGKKVKMLKRYIRRWGFTPESYRAAFGLPDDYPMTAPGYSARKREEALAVGLGSDENKAGVNVGRAAEMQAA